MRHKREVFIGLLILIVATLAFLLGWTNIFAVNNVIVNGSPSSEITKQVLLIADIQKGEKLARIEPRNIASKFALSDIDWVSSVGISRNWISREVEITLKAREAVAKYEGKYVDVNGVLFNSPVIIKKELPEVIGDNADTRMAGLNLYLNLPNDFSKKITKIVVSSLNNFQVHFENLQINWGRNSNNDVKIKIFRALNAIPENKNIKTMDLSDPSKPTVS